MSNTSNIINQINVSLEKEHAKFKINQSNIDKPFKETGVDSITVITIVTDIEDHFKITLDDEALMQLKTPKDLVNLIEKTIAKK